MEANQKRKQWREESGGLFWKYPGRESRGKATTQTAQGGFVPRPLQQHMDCLLNQVSYSSSHILSSVEKNLSFSLSFFYKARDVTDRIHSD